MRRITLTTWTSEVQRRRGELAYEQRGVPSCRLRWRRQSDGSRCCNRSRIGGCYLSEFTNIWNRVKSGHVSKLVGNINFGWFTRYLPALLVAMIINLFVRLWKETLTSRREYCAFDQNRERKENRGGIDERFKNLIIRKLIKEVGCRAKLVKW